MLIVTPFRDDAIALPPCHLTLPFDAATEMPLTPPAASFISPMLPFRAADYHAAALMLMPHNARPISPDTLFRFTSPDDCFRHLPRFFISGSRAILLLARGFHARRCADALITLLMMMPLIMS